ncbi:MAG: preprotein translocase subunit YajC [Clostridia bacterium]|nr:preprotein translocase subunit YajC [Clostridia bacterium]
MWGSLIMIVGFVALMYFMLIRPQKKQQKKEKQMRENLQIGDEIITIGGIYGRVVSLKEDSLVIESSGDRSKIQVQRSAVGQNLTIHE